jgi:cysteine synthase A
VGTGPKEATATFMDSILAHIGRTPLVRLAKLPSARSADVFAKCEHMNPSGSVKDRAALAMIEGGERRGLLIRGESTIIEATSGNTGIGLALVAAVKGYRLILTMPDNMSPERIALLRAYGAEIHLTPAAGVMHRAVEKAASIAAGTPGAFTPQQFRNRDNAEAHRLFTGPEILEQLAGRTPDAFVAGVGTGGTITGVGRALRAVFPDVRLIAVEPDASAVLNGGRPGPHRIQGIGAGFVPELIERELISEVRTVSEREAAEMQEALARREGLLVGISSGAAAKVALDVARELGSGKVVVTVLADTGERYVSEAASRGG